MLDSSTKGNVTHICTLKQAYALPLKMQSWARVKFVIVIFVTHMFDAYYWSLDTLIFLLLGENFGLERDLNIEMHNLPEM